MIAADNAGWAARAGNARTRFACITRGLTGFTAAFRQSASWPVAITAENGA